MASGVFICGLDAYRTDHTPRTQAHLDHGCATLSFEIPGTGDSPAAPGDANSPDRQLDSILDWLEQHATQYRIDVDRVIARGVSTGGYYAFRAAHTHADQLFAAVGQGGGAHRRFDPEWIGAHDHMEYPFALAEALAAKFGFSDDPPGSAVVQYAAEGSRFSLLKNGILQRPACRMLIINGMQDSIFPIEDSLLVAEHGGDNDLIVRGNREHMGNPGAEKIIYTWLDAVLADSYDY